MRADLVIVLSPMLCPLPSVLDVEKRVGVEQLVANSPPAAASTEQSVI
jgi:hypothetical protein